MRRARRPRPQPRPQRLDAGSHGLACDDGPDVGPDFGTNSLAVDDGADSVGRHRDAERRADERGACFRERGW